MFGEDRGVDSAASVSMAALFWSVRAAVAAARDRGAVSGRVLHRELQMDTAYDGRVLDEDDHLFAAIRQRLSWQSGRHFRSGVLQGPGMDRDLQMNLAYDGPVLNANDHLFAETR